MQNKKMNEQKIDELYSSALLSMSNENEMVYNVD
jgi:hypothetical protein